MSLSQALNQFAQNLGRYRERQDNRTRKRQIEYQTLHDFVITLAENVDMFEYVDTDDNEQQRTGLKNHVLLLSHKHPPQHRRRSGA